MSFNPKDDYEALGRLIYPSIEASGNLYYGQTRKLALDEIFKDGFKSVIKIVRLESEELGDEDVQLFVWSLGNFNGTVRLNSRSGRAIDINDAKFLTRFVRFAEYNIIPHYITNHDEDKNINTYSIDYTVEPTGNTMPIGPFNPINKTDAWDGRDFYFDSATNKLYIAITDDETKTAFRNLSSHQDELLKPITFTNTHVNPPGEIGNVILIKFYVSIDEPNLYQYRYTTDNVYTSDTIWHDVTDSQTHPSFAGIAVPPGHSIQFKCKSDIPYSSTRISGVHFSTNVSTGTPARLSISGNITSLIRTDFINDFSLVNENEFANMFLNTRYIEDASRLQLPATSLTAGCYSQMFYNCLDLVYSPELPATTLATNCYNAMFGECINLHKGPTVLPAIDLAQRCYVDMFYKASRLEHFPIILAKEGLIDELDGMFTECGTTDIFQLYLTDIISNGSTPTIVDYDIGVYHSYAYVAASSTNTAPLSIFSSRDNALYYPDCITSIIEPENIWDKNFNTLEPIGNAINIVSDDYSHLIGTNFSIYKNLDVSCESLTTETPYCSYSLSESGIQMNTRPGFYIKDTNSLINSNVVAYQGGSGKLLIGGNIDLLSTETTKTEIYTNNYILSLGHDYTAISAAHSWNPSSYSITIGDESSSRLHIDPSAVNILGQLSAKSSVEILGDISIYSDLLDINREISLQGSTVSIANDVSISGDVNITSDVSISGAVTANDISVSGNISTDTVSITPAGVFFGTNKLGIHCVTDGITGAVDSLYLDVPLIPDLPQKPNNNPNGELPIGSIMVIYVEANTYHWVGAQENKVGKRYHGNDINYTLYNETSNSSYTSKIYSARIDSDGRFVKTTNELSDYYFVGLTDGAVIHSKDDGFFVLAIRVPFFA